MCSILIGRLIALERTEGELKEPGERKEILVFLFVQIEDVDAAPIISYQHYQAAAIKPEMASGHLHASENREKFISRIKGFRL